jgi:hypothetical protein
MDVAIPYDARRPTFGLIGLAGYLMKVQKPVFTVRYRRDSLIGLQLFEQLTVNGRLLEFQVTEVG